MEVSPHHKRRRAVPHSRPPLLFVIFQLSSSFPLCPDWCDTLWSMAAWGLLLCYAVTGQSGREVPWKSLLLADREIDRDIRLAERCGRRVTGPSSLRLLSPHQAYQAAFGPRPPLELCSQGHVCREIADRDSWQPRAPDSLGRPRGLSPFRAHCSFHHSHDAMAHQLCVLPAASYDRGIWGPRRSTTPGPSCYVLIVGYDSG